MTVASTSLHKKGTVMLTTTQMLVLAGVVVLFAIVVFAWARSRTSRHRQAELKRRFGPEYDREVEQHGSVARAERELLAREKRVHRQHLKPLAENDRAKFTSDWRNVQARFVDDPSGAVQAADELIRAVMTARGYSNEGFERRVADLSVEHACVVQHYRAAHELADANREGRANTEELRQAVVHYRALFSDLLEQPQLQEQRLQEARA
jgi:FtsZ-interacting cell division protein ZipA